MHKYLPTYFEYMGNIFPQNTKNRFFKLMKHPHNSHEKCQWNYIKKAKRVELERIINIFFLSKMSGKISNSRFKVNISV